MNELEQYIKGYFGISEDHLSRIAALFKEETLAKSSFYLKESTYCNKLSFIRSGHLRIFKVLDDGKEITQWISSVGDFITELGGLIFHQKSDRYIQALDEVVLYTIDREDYERVGALVQHWEKLEKLFIAKCFVTLENRVFSLLSMDSKARYDYFFNLKPELFNSVPQQYIASMLGMSPETLSRIRSNS